MFSKEGNSVAQNTMPFVRDVLLNITVEARDFNCLPLTFS